MNKKTLLLLVGGVIVLLLVGAAVFTAMKLQEQGTESVAPNVPQSKPKAQSAPTGTPLQLSFNVTGATSSPTPTATPTAAPASTSTPAATATPAAATPTAATTTTTTTTTASKGSEATLPKAGFEAPTIIAISGGVLLLLIGLVLAL